MRIAIDMQGVQVLGPENEKSLEIINIIKKVIKSSKDDTVILVLNGMLSDSISFIRDEFYGFLSQDKIKVWDSLIKEDGEEKEVRNELACNIRELFILNLNVDVLLITSFFEGFDDNAVTRINKSALNIPTAVLLANELNYNIYSSQEYKKWFQTKKENLLSADVIFKSENFIYHDSFSKEEIDTINIVELLLTSHLESAIIICDNLRSLFYENNKLKVEGPIKNLRLAYISPLPPDRCGISDYSAELLPELARYYSIDVVYEQSEEITDPWVLSNCTILNSDEFRNNHENYDRVLYHFGNSPFHVHMIPLLMEIPGVIVLHDFFIPDLILNLSLTINNNPYGLVSEILYSHGWSAVIEYYRNSDNNDFMRNYPCNLRVLQKALGVIYHSDVSKRLVSFYYGSDTSNDWFSIPLLRTTANNDYINKSISRDKLDIRDNEFVVCSFGFLGLHKLNHRLLNAWLASPMANDSSCRLVFVGESLDQDYNLALEKIINRNDRVSITGWTDQTAYKLWLSSADVCVQLRDLSRGETSAAVLDCLNYGVATIVNANGSMADLPDNVVWKLPEKFSDEELIEALTVLYRDKKARDELGRSGSELLHTQHTPVKCAEKYMHAIESSYKTETANLCDLIKKIIQKPQLLTNKLVPDVATVLARNFPPKPRHKQLLVDVSALVIVDLRTGIQRVVRALLKQFISNPPDGYVVDAIYASAGKPGYRYARKFTCELLGIPDDFVNDEVVDVWSDDLFLGLDFNSGIVFEQQNSLKEWYDRGVKIYFMVYDILPVLQPNVFPENESALFHRWLNIITEFTGVVCISETVSKELRCWIQKNKVEKIKGFDINWFHLGADLNNSCPSQGMPKHSSFILTQLGLRKSFLTVSTIEPRKGHSQTLAAFELLWNKGIDINLVIVGKQGWMVETFIKKLHSHPEFNKRLFWLEGISDEFLENIYKKCDCLISASQGEGFGLPLIEAAQHNLPIIARDIPVFREVADDNALYFSGLDPDDLAIVIQDWLVLYDMNKIPNSNKIKWQTWEQSAQQLLDVLITENEQLVNS
ncbi:glycosyl transferases group 1 family protein [Yersinia rohdei]|uniref:Glycosyl transferases group 1 family protein n=1 Tax=Yersinia rohdei TaxID=29485 RepID=A0ABM5S7U4_YERRO|nr:glycosyltransferase [Yersinia rohdei]AJJ09307.1 glycosyl transferases group 1 family protein [Yersinia rohdei]EEQ04104.1 Glycosyl transferase, group 1 [Yersinia rohdei ATCC 43380]